MSAFHPLQPFTLLAIAARMTSMRLLSIVLCLIGLVLGLLGCLDALRPDTPHAIPIAASFGLGSVAICVGLILRNKITATDR